MQNEDTGNQGNKDLESKTLTEKKLEQAKGNKKQKTDSQIIEKKAKTKTNSQIEEKTQKSPGKFTFNSDRKKSSFS